MRRAPWADAAPWPAAGEPALVLADTAPDQHPAAAQIEADGARLLRTVAEHVAAGSVPPRWCAALFRGLSADAVSVAPEGTRMAREVRRMVSAAVSSRTGITVARGLYGRPYRTTIAGMRRELEGRFPVLAGAPVELFALLCYLDERGPR